MTARLLVVAFLLAATGAAPAAATSGWGCFRVINVRVGDVLNLRAKPSGSSPVVDKLTPGKHGILAEAGPCRPASTKPSKQWCPLKHFNGNRTTEGWAKLIYLAPSECP